MYCSDMCSCTSREVCHVREHYPSTLLGIHEMTLFSKFDKNYTKVQTPRYEVEWWYDRKDKNET